MNTLEQRIEFLERRVAQLEQAQLEQARNVYGPIPPMQPYMPSPPPGWEPTIKCPKCGMGWKGAMGYSCPHNDCPVQPKVTC